MATYQTLRLILGDQLNEQHSWFAEQRDDVLYLIAELQQETGYVRHHIQKVCLFFSAMEAFASRLEALGHQVLHLTLDDTAEDQDLPALLERLCAQHDIREFEYQQPDEYRLHAQLEALTIKDATKLQVETEHFFVNHQDLGKYFKKGKAHRMEQFYRKTRTEHDVLMSDGKPLQDRWNFDAANRNKLKKADLESIPVPLLYRHDVTSTLERLDRHNVQTIGQREPQLTWPITREESLDLLKFFCSSQLSLFGTFQDAMTEHSPHRWSLYHSRLSFAMNTKLISPHEVIDAAVAAFEQDDSIDIAQVEGFVRQIIGWREFIRGIYWINMPDYGMFNSLNAERALPDFYWTGDTKMNCMSQCINQSLEYAYAHHIQRLMVTGTFSLLAGIHPDEVDAWYLGIYVDALEWVEMPNTRGMSQAADHGIVASKPYAASGNYINKMSDYCSGCFYKVKEKTGERGCPFNSLYWHFMHRHRAHLEKNPRIGMVYRNWDKQAASDQDLVLERAEWCLDNLDAL